MITLQTKPEKWLCQATSWAMACDVPVDYFMRVLGHDGSEVGWPDLDSPRNRVGHHVHECAATARALGFIPSPIEVFPASIPRLGENPRRVQRYMGIEPMNYAEGFIELYRGVIQCVTASGRGHAVAFDRGEIFDPDGHTYPLCDIPVTPVQVWTLHEQAK